MKLNDALGKVDMGLEATLRKVEKQAFDLNPDIELKVENENGEYTRDQYITRFQWDNNKFNRSRSLMEIAHTLQERVKSIDGQIKQAMDQFHEANQQLSSLQKGKAGSYSSSDLSDFIYGKVSDKCFVPFDSVFLVNLLVIVPARKERDFLDNYVVEDTKNDTHIVPGSAQFLELEDAERNRIYRVVLFQKFPDSTKPRSIAGFPAKLFSYNEQKYEDDQKLIKELTIKRDHMGTVLEKRCKLLFGELYIACMHLKVMRVYIDGVLRFGIPPIFLMTFIKTDQHEKRILKGLTEKYAEPHQMDMYGSKDEIQDTEDFYPFVVVNLTL